MLNALLASVLLISACQAEAAPGKPTAELPSDFVQTSSEGDRLRALRPPRFVKGRPTRGIVVAIDPKIKRQTLEGFGGALTESSAFVLANLSQAKRGKVLDAFFGPGGARFTLVRVPIGACDFSVEGKFSYDDVPGDVALQHFSLAPDRRGFPAAQDPSYALLPLIKDALAREPRIKIVASPWTAPAWMKDNGEWYGGGRGGSLLPAHYDTFARYMVKYLQSCEGEGVPVWAVTPVNEPLGNGGQWESMEFNDTAMREYIGSHLGPRLAEAGFAKVKILGFDHNRDGNALRFAETLLGSPPSAGFLWGLGLHWYSSTRSACPEILDSLRRRFPDKPLLHTEGCVDGIGTEDNSPNGRFLGWRNDRWWWTEAATDWGFHWAAPAERPDHPRYAPVHRYARDLIDGLNHGLAGWIDWNIVLDQRGGPNHVGNFCAAPVMADTASGEVYFTPIYAVLSHFSRYLQPGDSVVRTQVSTPGLDPDDFHATAAVDSDGRSLLVIVFNKSGRPLQYRIRIGPRHALVNIPGNALQSIRFDLGKLN